MWEINEEAEVQIMELEGSKIYQIDNVFKDSETLFRWLFNRPTMPVQGAPWSRNLIQYYKARYKDYRDDAAPIVTIAQHLCKQKVGYGGGFQTNIESWLHSDFNSYKTHYWFPHIDNGYNCIVYFHDTNGTNLYHPKLKDEEWFQKLMNENIPNGKQPWIPKEKVELLHELKPAWNRMVLFDGKHFPHNTAVNDETFFSDSIFGAARDKRCNLCFFFYP